VGCKFRVCKTDCNNNILYLALQKTGKDLFMNKKLNWLRKIGIAEGISFLVLLCIAMPLKYFFQQPMAVKIFGWAHGVLFVAFLFLAWEYKTDRNKSLKWFATAFLAAIIPTGTFFFDMKLKQEISTQ
jgi:integral membrane protein